MHNSQNGEQVADTADGYNYLLIDANSSDTCLSCHAAYGQFYGGPGYGPGGDFYWLTKTYTWTAHGGTETSTATATATTSSRRPTASPRTPPWRTPPAATSSAST